MTTAFAIRTVIEFLVSLFVIYCVIHEKEIIVIEDKIIKMIKKKIYLRKHRKLIAKRQAAKKAQAARRKINESQKSKSERKVYDVLYAA